MKQSIKYSISIIVIVFFVKCDPYKKFEKTKPASYRSYIVKLNGDTLFSINSGRIGLIGKGIDGIYHEVFDDHSLKIKVPVVNGFYNGSMLIFNKGKLFGLNEYRHGKLKGFVYYFDDNGCIIEKKYIE